MSRCPSSQPGRLAGLRRGGWLAARSTLIAMGVAGLLYMPSGSPLRAAPADERVKVAELTAEVETAIDRGLKALAAIQNKDGSWGSEYRVASTSLTLMAFMLKGHFPKKGPYGAMLDRGIEYLLKRCSEGVGYMGINMYEHGLATLALSEAWGMSDRDEIRDQLKAAVQTILRSQNKAGGWRYSPAPTDADISVTVMQMMALASAKEAGISVPTKTIENAVRYVLSCQVPSNGGFGYQSPNDPLFPRSAAGTMSLLISGESDSATLRQNVKVAISRGLAYLKRLPDSKFTVPNGFFFYGHYYALQAMYQSGEDNYQEWYPHIRDMLLARQLRDGMWQAEADPAYGTAMACLMLGVPYRYLPIYQR